MLFESWINSNLGPKPEGCTLDRIDSEGNYEPGNLRWSTASEQNYNRKKGWTKNRNWTRKLGNMWCGRFHLNGKEYYAGSFSTREEAQAASEKMRAKLLLG